MKIVVALSVVVTIVINLLANIIPYNGVTTAEVSDSFSVFFVPAGYVFSIWGVIYLGLIAFAIYQLRNNYKVFKEISWYVVLAGLLNSLWIILWHYNFIPSTLPIMLALLLVLIKIYTSIYSLKSTTRNFNIFVKIPFSIYLGWITVATVANVTVFLNYFGIESLVLSGSVWSALLIVVAMLLAIYAMYKSRDYAYALVIVWASVGIAVKFSDVLVILYTALICVAIITAFIFSGVYTSYLKRKG